MRKPSRLVVGTAALAAAASVAAGFFFGPGVVAAASNYPAPNFSQVLAGLPSGGQSAPLPARCNADPDLVTCHLVVEGYAGGTDLNQNIDQIGGTSAAGILSAIGTAGTTNAIEVQGSGTMVPFLVTMNKINGAILGAPTAAGTTQTGNIQGFQGVTGGVPVAITAAGASNATIASGATSNAIRTSAGHLAGFVITATGTGGLQCYDALTATGTVIASIPASAPLGYIPNPMSFATGLSCVSAASGPAATISYGV